MVTVTSDHGFCAESPTGDFKGDSRREGQRQISCARNLCGRESVPWYRDSQRHPCAQGPDQVLESTIRSDNRVDL